MFFNRSNDLIWLCRALYSIAKAALPHELDNLSQSARIKFGKGEIAYFQQFHLFPQCFPKAFFFSVLK